MKLSSILAALVCLCMLAVPAAPAQQTNKATTSVNLVNVPLGYVLDLYGGVTKKQLVIASDVREARNNITLRFAGPQEELPRLIEQALLKQAGIVITRLDDKRSSVTYKNPPKSHP